MTLSVGSLFSGIGGLDIGLERTGAEVLWQVEVDGFCREQLDRRWKGMDRYDDIRRLDPLRLPPVDLVCGGFPCQPVSLAGLGRGTADERWLWPEFSRALRALGPSFAVVENVPGILVRGWRDVLGDLAEIGYDAEWLPLPASAVGSLQIRERIFIVAYPNGERWGGRSGLFGTGGGPEPANRGEALADADRQRTAQPQGRLGEGGRRPGDRGGGDRETYWSTVPEVGRLVDGFSDRRRWLGALGNAVVPQVAEWIGRRIVEHAEVGE